MSRLVVVGAGVIGTALALEAAERGHEVTVLERELAPRGASVRNFGLVWICGRDGGRELELALAGRARWAALAVRAPAIGFRAIGCLVVARDEGEEAVLEAACARDDAAVRRFALLAPEAARRLNPALGGVFRAALHSPLDAVVEPAASVVAVRELAQATGRVSFLFGRTALGAEEGTVVDHLGERHPGDAAVLCPGDRLELLPGELVDGRGLRRRRLQMLSTDSPGTPLPTALADGDALRYYPAFALPARDGLAEPSAAVTRYGAQLLVAPRPDGGLTVGDSHVDDEAGAFGADEEAYEHLLGRLSELTGGSTPRVRRRWTGSYLRRTDGEDVLLREEIAPAVFALTALGGLGMTAAPAVAAETADALGL